MKRADRLDDLPTHQRRGHKVVVVETADGFPHRRGDPIVRVEPDEVETSDRP